MNRTAFDRKFTAPTGVGQLMEDLGEAAAASSDSPLYMLGGGNPGVIDPMLQEFRNSLHDLADNSQLAHILGTYDSPQGEHHFRTALAEQLSRHFGWPITAANIALTHGSQNAFFTLFNLLAGSKSDSASESRILLPLTPEYIGYTDTGLTESLFVSRRPLINFVDSRLFKYAVDFDSLGIDHTIKAMCVSRPTNPTGNVLTNAEIEKLKALAISHEIPLIIDGAYGLPFPGIVFNDATVTWDEHLILCLSLSKLGLPGVRTGIVIARESLIEKITAVNAVTSLAVGSLGPAIVQPMVDSGAIFSLSKTVIKPYYHKKAQLTLSILNDVLGDTPWRVHAPEGAFFIWLWLPELPISTQQLYERLKARRVFVIPGHHFFPGLEDDAWGHKKECVRISYAGDDATVRKGLSIVGEEVQRAYAT